MLCAAGKVHDVVSMCVTDGAETHCFGVHDPSERSPHPVRSYPVCVHSAQSVPMFEHEARVKYFITFECVQLNDESNVNIIRCTQVYDVIRASDSIVMYCVRGTSKYYESVQNKREVLEHHVFRHIRVCTI